MVFPVVVYGCESWTIMKAECWRIDAFELWCWRRLLRIPWISVKFSSVVSDSLWPHGLQHTRLSCPPSPRACSNSCPLKRWYHPTISPSVDPFSYLQYFPEQGLFQWVSSSHQVARVLELVLASVLLMNIQDLFALGLTVLISLQSKGLSRVFSNTTIQKHQFFSTQPSLWSNSHFHTWLLERT